MVTQENMPNWRHLPLRSEYPFADEHGLGTEIMAIRVNPGFWSGLRRGLVVQLFRSRGVCEAYGVLYSLNRLNVATSRACC